MILCAFVAEKAIPTIALSKQKSGESKIENDNKSTKTIRTESKILVHGIVLSQ